MKFQSTIEEYREMLNRSRNLELSNKLYKATTITVELGIALDKVSMLSDGQNEDWFHETDQVLANIAGKLVKMTDEIENQTT